nr:ATP-binding protein [Oculatella sp. LEGE 06141]
MSWLAAGRALLPLRFLTEMARSITGSDLTRRIPVKGSDEIAELSKTFNEMLDRLQATFVSQRNFINDAGHELRTPITIVRGHLELMGSDPQEQGETLDLVFDELDRMNRFVNDLLLLAKAEQPDFLNVAPVDTDLITLEFFAKAKALAERDWRIVIENPGCVVVDRQRLTQAVMNLAHNATHHTRREDTIEIGSSLTATDARFWVRDTGEGIPLAEQERIFERFARGAKNRRSEGAGLGLAIVSAIAEAHGGRIELSSQVAIGSTFAIILPVVTLQAGLESVSGI